MKKFIENNIINLTIISSISIFLIIALNNLIINLIRTEVGINFSWLLSPSGFALGESSVPFEPSDSYLWALISGLINSLKIILCGLICSTFIGTLAGIARISSNKLMSIMAALYVAISRQTPLLLQLLFWYFVCFLALPEQPVELLNSQFIYSNKGIIILGLKLTVEFSALLVGLTLFTGASISEVIRGGLNSISKGQIEASKSLGLNENDEMRLIIIPQALPSIIPGLTSQYLNLAKNSTLAIAVGYPDIYAISDTTITQTGRSIEGFLIILCTFLILNLIINRLMLMINSFALKINQIDPNKRI
tara:strand:- start:172 stop:1089 length:918 start_codon:yes stop_codon:yes gene_type:complete